MTSLSFFLPITISERRLSVNLLGAGDGASLFSPDVLSKMSDLESKFSECVVFFDVATGGVSGGVPGRGVRYLAHLPADQLRLGVALNIAEDVADVSLLLVPLLLLHLGVELREAVPAGALLDQVHLHPVLAALLDHRGRGQDLEHEGSLGLAALPDPRQVPGPDPDNVLGLEAVEAALVAAGAIEEGAGGATHVHQGPGGVTLGAGPATYIKAATSIWIFTSFPFSYLLQIK